MPRIVVDALNDVGESLPDGEWNNSTVGTSVITAQPDDLFPHAHISGDWFLDGTDLVYDVEIPAHSHVSVALTSPQHPAETFVGFNFLPDDLFWDYSIAAGQTAVIPNPGDSPL